MAGRKPRILRQGRLIKITGQIPGQPDEVYTRLPKREYVARREIFDDSPPDHLAGFDYDEWVEMGAQGVQRAQAKLAQGQPLTRQEKELLGLIKKRPGAYKSELGRPMTPAERQRARRAKLKGEQVRLRKKYQAIKREWKQKQRKKQAEEQWQKR
ncbi:2769_t:CDS:2 [Entrophospora sp. SA101]|nr:2769_t:CDS:2 [Entrophospora sp. SA101]